MCEWKEEKWVNECLNERMNKRNECIKERKINK